MDPRELRRLYNHRSWPSPRARIVAKNLGFEKKRMTHEEALTWLAGRLRLTIPEFLAMDSSQAWKALGCITWSNGYASVYDPLYGLYSPYKNRKYYY